MKGHPWRSWWVNEALHGRHLMMYLQMELKHLGWTLLCSADVSAKCHRDKEKVFHSELMLTFKDATRPNMFAMCFILRI